MKLNPFMELAVDDDDGEEYEGNDNVLTMYMKALQHYV